MGLYDDKCTDLFARCAAYSKQLHSEGQLHLETSP